MEEYTKDNIRINVIENESKFIGKTITVHLDLKTPPDITILTNVLSEDEMGSILLAVASDLLGVDTEDLIKKLTWKNNNFER